MAVLPLEQSKTTVASNRRITSTYTFFEGNK